MPAKKTNQFSSSIFWKNTLFRPAKKTVKAVKKGLKKPRTKTNAPTTKKVAKLMAIKIALASVEIKDLKTRREIKQELLNHFSRCDLLYKEKNSLKNVKKFLELTARANKKINQIIKQGNVKDASRLNARRIGAFVDLAEAKRNKIKKRLDKK